MISASGKVKWLNKWISDYKSENFRLVHIETLHFYIPNDAFVVHTYWYYSGFSRKNRPDSRK